MFASTPLIGRIIKVHDLYNSGMEWKEQTQGQNSE
jgi:hypothetical protein